MRTNLEGILTSCESQPQSFQLNDISNYSYAQVTSQGRRRILFPSDRPGSPDEI